MNVIKPHAGGPKDADNAPRLRAAAKSPWGRVLLIGLCFAGLLPAFGSMALPFTAAIALASLWPQHRRSILSALAITVCVISIGPKWLLGAPQPETDRLALRALLAVAAWVAALLAWSRFLASLPGWMVRHSLLWLHGAAVLLIASLWALSGRGTMNGGAAAALCTVVPELLWRSSYWMKWRLRQGARAPMWQNLFAALPFVGAGGVPFGKGPTFLAKHEVRDEDQLATAQLKGAALLLLAFAWRLLDAGLSGVLWGLKAEWTPAWAVSADAILPTMDALLRTPDLFSSWQRWAGLFGELFHNILALGIYGHTIVGVFCLAGFRIPRNTDAPLLATTVLDFWSRYYFYFKELLMDFFFFPVFLRLPGVPVLARTLVATFAAAFFGNVYYHILLYSQKLIGGDMDSFVSLASARLIYCALLASALCVSFARSLKSPGRSRNAGLPRRLAQMAGVSTLFAVLHVWNYGGGEIAIQQRLDLWMSLLPWN